MKKSFKFSALLASLAFCMGAMAPIVASASDGTQYRNLLECMQFCGGSCNFFGRCFLVER